MLRKNYFNNYNKVKVENTHIFKSPRIILFLFVIIESIRDIPNFLPFASPFTQLPPHHRPSPHYYMCPWLCIWVFWLISSHIPSPFPTEICPSVPCFHVPGPILFISLFFQILTLLAERNIIIYIWQIS